VTAAGSWLPAAARGPYDMAIDVGTAYVRVFVRGRGLVVDEPSLVRVWRSPLAVQSVGTRAYARHANDQASFPVQPLSKGVVRNEESAGWLLASFIRRAWGLTLSRPRVLACAPTDATEEEIESLRNALRRAGASSVTVVPEPLAAAAGAGLDAAAPQAQVLVDVGEGVTDVAVIRQGRIEAPRALRVGCFDLRQAVADHLAQSQGLLLPPEAVEDLIRKADGPGPDAEAFSVEATVIDRAALLAAMGPTLDRIAGVVGEAWSELPEATRAEVGAHGLWLTGGGALLRSVLERVRQVTSIEPRVPENPLHAVITGASRMLLACNQERTAG
jgi:rod shape-determining protein MreB